MNLRQAYDGWSQQEQNRTLYVKTRDAFRKAWFTLPTNKPCSWYDRDVLALALAETRVVESDKVKAASVMVHVLTWANFAEPKYNPAPSFTTEDVTRLIRLPADELEKERERITAAMQTMAETSEPEAEPKSDPCEGCNNVKGCITCKDGDQRAVITEVKPTNIENNMSEKKQRGKQPKPVAQLDAKTLQVIKVWPSRCEAERETGACNLDRAIAGHRMSAGSYWCQPEDAAGFKPNPKSGNQPQKPKAKKTVIKPSPAVQVAVTEDPTPSSVTQQPVVVAEPSPAQKALVVFSDDELLDELDRRGWVGELQRMQVVTIGEK